MQAMDAATTSAKDMLKDLSIKYNRVRQAAITPVSYTHLDVYKRQE